MRTRPLKTPLRKLGYIKKWKAEHADHVRAYQRQWHREHPRKVDPEKRRRDWKRYYKAHRAERIAATAAWKKRHPEHVRQKNRQYSRAYRARRKQAKTKER